MPTEKQPTLRQVAERAGVSTSSASMILSNRAGVSFSEDTVRRVLAAADELSYSRRKYRSQMSVGLDPHTIVVFCPNVTNPYYATTVQSIEQSAQARGYDVLICNTYRDPELEARLLSSVQHSGAAGVIFAMPPSAPTFVERASLNLPTVVIGDRNASVNVDTVETNNFAAGVLVAKHLLALGHRHFAFLSTTLDAVNSARTMRLDGIRHALAEHAPDADILVRSEAVSPTAERANLSLEHSVGYELCRSCLEQEKQVTAYVGVNDMVAYGVVDAILDGGYRIPGDFSVCGFDNNFPSFFTSVSLTTIDPYMADRGHNAFELLYGKIASFEKKEPRPAFITRVEFQQQLVVRCSTGPVRSGNAKPARS